MRISGPIFAYQIKYGEVNYFLFGDQHAGFENSCPMPCTSFSGDKIVDYTPSCYDIEVWLDLVFRQPGVDFFLEKGLFLSTIMPGYIGRIYKRFESCFTRKACFYPGVRFHYIDVRSFEGSNTSISHYLLDLVENVNPSLEENYLRITEIKRVLILYAAAGRQLLKIFLTSDQVEKDLQKILSEDDPIFKLLTNSWLVSSGRHRIRKQLLKLASEGQAKLAEQIVNFILHKYDVEIRSVPKPAYKMLDDWLDLIRTNQFTEFVKNYKSQEPILISVVITIVVLTEALGMDAYTLARMFRHFNQPQYKIKIVYAGAIHTSRYLEFFQTLGVKLVLPKLTEVKRCSTLQ